MSLQSVRVHLFSMKMASFNISFHVYIDIHPVVIIMIQIQDDIESKVQITFAKAHWGRIHILYFLQCRAAVFIRNVYRFDKPWCSNAGGLTHIFYGRFFLLLICFYCIPKKSWPILYGKLLYRFDQDFLERQYTFKGRKIVKLNF